MTAAQFIRGFRMAYEHRGGLKMFACGKVTDSWFEQIRSEVNWIVGSQAASDVASPGHVTNWVRPTGVAKQFSLLNASGRADDFASDHSFNLEGKKLVFPELKVIERFARLFGSQLINLRLNGLGPSSGLGAHEERPIQPNANSVTYKIRFHLPIFTNPESKVCLDEEQFHFEEGVLYFFNQGCVHAAINRSSMPRYHFVLDCLYSKALWESILSLNGRQHAESGFIPFSESESLRHSKPEPWSVPEFVTEDGDVVTKGILYGRKAPTVIDHYRNEHPRAFTVLDRLLGR